VLIHNHIYLLATPSNKLPYYSYQHQAKLLLTLSFYK